MTGKQKRFLRAMASTMAPVVNIGKGGLEDGVKISAKQAIEARELIKVKILQNAIVDRVSTFEALAEYMYAELVQIIGANGVFFKQKEKDSKIELPK